MSSQYVTMPCVCWPVWFLGGTKTHLRHPKTSVTTVKADTSSRRLMMASRNHTLTMPRGLARLLVWAVVFICRNYPPVIWQPRQPQWWLQQITQESKKSLTNSLWVGIWYSSWKIAKGQLSPNSWCLSMFKSYIFLYVWCVCRFEHV